MSFQRSFLASASAPSLAGCPASGTAAVLIATLAGCAAPRPFPLRPPVLVDTDLLPVSVPCRLDPAAKDDHPWNCAPREYVSPFVWDQVDNLWFAPVSRALSIEVTGEAVNANSLDEVPDSAWFTNRPRAHEVDAEADAEAPGACTADDVLPAPDRVHDGEVLAHSLGVARPGLGEDGHLLARDALQRFRHVGVSAVGIRAVDETESMVIACPEQVRQALDAQLGLVRGVVVADRARAHGQPRRLDTRIAQRYDVRSAELARRRSARDRRQALGTQPRCAQPQSSLAEEFSAFHDATSRLANLTGLLSPESQWEA